MIPIHDQQIELQSEELQELIGRAPSAITRWGMTVIFTTITIMLFATWFIEYPDLLVAKVTVTTNPLPVTLVSRTNGRLTLVKKAGDLVSKNELICFIDANVSPNIILELETSLKQSDTIIPFADSSLGELETDYGNLTSAAQAYNEFVQSTVFEIQIEQLNKQEKSYKRLQETLVRQQVLASQELKLAKEKFGIDSVLYLQKVIALSEYNKEKGAWLQQQRSYSNAQMAIITNEILINELSKQVAELRIERKEGQHKLELGLEIAKKSLLASISKWKETYLFLAPIEGKIAYLGFLENNFFSEGGKAIVSVIPNDEVLIAQAELPSQNSGKLKEGQRVNIRLENYPFEEYGSIEGRISSVSLIPRDGTYFVGITLPHGLQTSQNRVLEFKQQLTGTTEIITEDLKLIERFFFQFRKLIGSK